MQDPQKVQKFGGSITGVPRKFVNEKGGASAVATYNILIFRNFGVFSMNVLDTSKVGKF